MVVIDDFEDTASNAGWDEETSGWTRTSSPSSTENGTPTIKSGSRIAEIPRNTTGHIIGGANLSVDPSKGMTKAWFWVEYASSFAGGIERCATYDSNGNMTSGYYLGTKDNSDGLCFLQRYENGSVASETQIGSNWISSGEWMQIRWDYDGSTHNIEFYSDSSGVFNSASVSDSTFTSGDAGIRNVASDYSYAFWDLMEGEDTSNTAVTTPMANASTVAVRPSINPTESTGTRVTIDGFEDTATNAGWDEEVNYTRTSSPTSTENGTPNVREGSRVLEIARSTAGRLIGGSGLATDPSAGLLTAWFWPEYASASVSGIERCATYDSNGALTSGYYLGTKDDGTGAIYLQRYDSGAVASETQIGTTEIGSGEWTQIRWDFSGSDHDIELYTPDTGIWSSGTVTDSTYSSGDAGLRTRGASGYSYGFWDIMEGEEAAVAIATPTATATASTQPVTTTVKDTATVSVTATTASASSPAPTITSRDTATVAVTVTTATATSPAPVITDIEAPVISPAAATATASSPAPAITDIEYVSVLPGAATATASAQPATVAIRNPATIAPTAATASTSQPAPAAVSDEHPVIGPTAATATASAPTPLVQSDNWPTITVGMASATTTTGSVVVSMGQVLQPPAATATATGTSPALTRDKRMPMPTATATASTEPAVISIDQPVPVGSPATATATTHLPEPVTTVTATVTPSATTETDTANAVTVRDIEFPTIQPAAATATAGGVLPNIEIVSAISTLPASVEGTTTVAEVDANFAVTTDHSYDEPGLEAEADNKRYRRKRPSPPRASRVKTPERISTQAEQVYTPDRRLRINGIEIGTDRDLKVSATEYGFAIADCTVYNLDSQTWTRIARDDDIKIELGWKQADLSTVFTGKVMVKRRRSSAGGRKYIIRARGHGAGAITNTHTYSFNNLAPHRMVERIVGNLEGVGRGYIARGSERIPGSYAISSGKELADWLDRLAKVASGQTDRQWVWYIEAGKLYFHPKKEPVTDPVGFAMGNSVTRATPSGVVTGDQTQQDYDIEMRCEPIVKRGLVTTLSEVPAVNPDNLFRVSRYVHESSTTSGRHHTTATLSPMFKDLGDLE